MKERLKKIFKTAWKVILFILGGAFLLFCLLLAAVYNSSSNDKAKKETPDTDVSKRLVSYLKDPYKKEEIKLDVKSGCLYYSKDGVFEILMKNKDERDCDMKYVDEYNAKNKK